MSRLVPILLAAACMVIALWLYPVDSDAAFAVYDAVWYGEHAMSDPAGSISPHHPLFHVFVLAFAAPLDAMGVPGSGHVATRIVAGLGGAWLLLQICAIAGRRRALVGGAFAFALFCTRGFLVEMGTGENVLPAAAAALFALRCAARPDPSLLTTGLALAFAGLMRQDNVFIAFGVAAALVMGLPAGRRLSGLFKVGGWVLAATVAGYGAAWIASTGGKEPLVKWLTRLGVHGAWTGPQTFEWGRLGVHAFTVALATTGRLTPVEEDHPAVGLAYLAALLVPGWLLRGSTPGVRLGVAMVAAVIPRAFFYTWYEADNFEWLILPVAFAAAFGAGLARGEPVTPLLARRAGVAILLLLSAWMLVAHGPYTWRLRQRRLMTSVEALVDEGRSRWRFLPWEAREALALHLLGVRDYDVVLGRGMTIEDGLKEISRKIEANPVTTVVVADRFVMDGMPFTMRNRFPWITDWMQDPPNWEIIRRDGLGYAARWTPPAESPAESRR